MAAVDFQGNPHTITKDEFSEALEGCGIVEADHEILERLFIMLDKTGGPISGAKNWSSGYMPAQYQGTVLRSEGPPILDLEPGNMLGGGVQRSVLDHLRAGEVGR